MRYLLIEDEALAAEKLQAFMSRYHPEAQLVAQLSSVAQVLAFFDAPEPLDLIVADVELTDGQVFHALERLQLPCPVLFSTAYDQYWMQVFQYQAVDYLLKPYAYSRFSEAMANLQQRRMQQTNQNKGGFKKRFLVRQNQELVVLPVAQVCLIQAAGGALVATDSQAQQHVLQETNLSELEAQLDPQQFFRLNRSDLIHIDAVLRIESYTKDSLAVYCAGSKEALLTSKTRTAAFRRWLNQ
ncbi:LytR/AlgR family response regulator transcription factor [Rheinheimera marina]|uniref:LytR/AlgR family response regulator transcription factor n=1 Tax=Rheinheimera marina TaxID=1774958 RepID=A0ABV9JQK5_9GAMM